MPDVLETRPRNVPPSASALGQNHGDDFEPEVANYQRHFVLFQAVPAWAISMLVHVVVLVLLGLLTIADPVKIVNVLSASSSGEEGPEIEEFTIDEIDPGEISETEEAAEPMVDVTETMDVVEPIAVDVPMEIAAVPIDMSDLAAEMAPSAASLQSLASMSSQSFDSRSSDSKKRLLREFGGNDSSEAAVARALKWLAKHQMPNGAWTFMHTAVRSDSGGNPGDTSRAKAFNGATAMALLPFLGAGQTHLQGEYKDVIKRGLLFLVANGKPKVISGMPTLDFTESGGTLYSHGLAAIVLCEAFAMTEDPALLQPAQAAINFTAYAQNADGGWRYQVRGQTSDTSVVGWHLMALKSAYMGHLTVPPTAIRGAVSFLDRVQSDGGALYGYTDRITKIQASPACTAIGLLSRMYTGWDKQHPAIQKGVQNLSEYGVSKTNVYYNYYAAQVLRHHGGPEWDAFNTELRDWLVAQQVESGGASGSWFYGGGHATDAGGRLYVTSMSTMILEVYYRHMPIYAATASEDDFPL